MTDIASSPTMAVDDDDDRKTLKRQKKEYRDEKKRVTAELVHALRDPTVVVMADWLKVRGSLRKWNRYFCVLKPGLLLIYKTDKTHKQGHWIGTVLLNVCELIERPSKKDGFCFKLFHPLDNNIWATRGPLGESHGAVTLQRLPSTYLICRAPSDQAGRCWMDALELALRCSGLLMRTMHKLEGPKEEEREEGDEGAEVSPKDSDSIDGDADKSGTNGRPAISETEAEKHFSGLDDQDDIAISDAGSENNEVEESPWIYSEPEQFGSLGDGAQTGDVGEENKSLLWSLLKQVRPGMDLSKVVLPTFILEPRSFLEKLSDYYFHADLLQQAALEEDPYKRILMVAKFYLSGFYKKPKGLKKPYNPILGETFRCCFEHPDGSTTYYLAEQVSHHPPVSSLFVTNRKAGFDISATILAKSKYYGNSVSAMMLGKIRIRLLNRGETYTLGLPYANCKGIMLGPMTMELGGNIAIECDRTAYTCSLEFKLKPLFGGSMNVVSGEIKLGKQTLSEIEGHWDGQIMVKNKDGTKEILWEATPDTIKRRLQRKEIPFDQQDKWESKKLWAKVTEAIMNEDQYTATDEKTKLEEDQRRRAKSGVPHETKYFKHNHQHDTYEYIYAENRPWDLHNDVKQVEHNYHVRTICKVKPSVKAIKKANRAAEEPSDDSSNDSHDQTGHSRRSKHAMKIPDDGFHEIKEALGKIEVSMCRLNDKMDNMIWQTSNSLKAFQIVLFVLLLCQVYIAFMCTSRGGLSSPRSGEL